MHISADYYYKMDASEMLDFLVAPSDSLSILYSLQTKYIISDADQDIIELVRLMASTATGFLFLSQKSQQIRTAKE